MRQSLKATRGRSSGRAGAGWIMAGSVTAALLGVALVAELTGPGLHPAPRVAEQASHVMPAERYERSARVREAYTLAAAIPGVFDGIYCYCRCSEHSGHYSLLDCFADDHAAGCDVCMREAEMAFDMSSRGSTLEQIRDQVDRMYGT